MRPRQPETDHFHDMLKASVGLDGFFLERHPELAPVETAVEGVLLAGTVQGPKDIVDTVAQASAAAAKAAVFLAHDQVRLDPAVAVVDPESCRGCGDCVDICQFHAPRSGRGDPGVFAAEINASLCKGCGTCASWCPSGAIAASHFTDRQVLAQIDAFFDEAGHDLPTLDVPDPGQWTAEVGGTELTAKSQTRTAKKPQSDARKTSQASWHRCDQSRRASSEERLAAS